MNRDLLRQESSNGKAPVQVGVTQDGKKLAAALNADYLLNRNIFPPSE